MNNLKHTMQVILSKLGQGIILGVGFFAVAGVAFAAITWPSALPDGESDGGTFSSLLKNILVDQDLNPLTNSGMVKDSDKVDGLHANELLAAGGSSVSTNPMIFAYKGDVTCDAGMRKVYFRDGGKCYIDKASHAIGCSPINMFPSSSNGEPMTSDISKPSKVELSNQTDYIYLGSSNYLALYSIDGFAKSASNFEVTFCISN